VNHLNSIIFYIHFYNHLNNIILYHKKVKYVCYSNSRDVNEERDDISTEYLHLTFVTHHLYPHPFNYHVRLAHFRAEKTILGKTPLLPHRMKRFLDIERKYSC